MAYSISNDGYYQDLFPQYGFGFFAAGNSVRFYRYSLYWLVHYVGLGDVAAEVQKDGEPFLYGQISTEDLDRLVADGLIVGLKRHAWGVSWLYKNQSGGGLVYSFAGYTEWRNNMLKGTKGFLYDSCEHSGQFGQMIWSA